MGRAAALPLETDLREAAEERYLSYALSVITARALPDARHLRRDARAADRPPERHPAAPDERLDRHRGRHGDQHSAPRPEGGGGGADGHDRRTEPRREGAAQAREGPRLPDRGRNPQH